ncbi:MAG TPA: S9 family peptidase [Bryobacteraceae bacterium]|jgi:dipeptidyl aminopeptidase/acylaminoacyl peptidase
MAKLSQSLFLISSLFITQALVRAEDARIDQVLNQIEQVHAFSSVTISPDGKWITWVQPTSRDSDGSEIFLLNWSDAAAKPIRVTAGSGTESTREHGVAWAPDSSRLVFFSNANSSQDQVFVFPVNGGNARALTDLKGYVKDIRWSPDGKEIAFLYAEQGGGGGPLEAEPAAVGVIGGSIHNQRLTIVSAAAGDTQSDIGQVSPADLNIYEYDWSPDGKQFAVTAAPGPADNNWWIAKLYTVDRASGQMKMLYQPPAEQQIAVPRWSPDGRQIAFIGGLMSDEGFNGGDILALPGTGGAVRNLTPGIHGTPSGFTWQGNGKLLFTEALEGGGAIASLDIPTGQTETLWKGAQTLHQDGNYPNFSLAKDGRTSVAIRSTWEQPPEIFAGPIGEWKQLTHENADQQPHWGKAESVVWNSGKFKVQGWLLYPENYNAQKRYPMVVEIHGGPASLRSASWPNAHFDMSVMAALGYFVFFPNPRGSYGEGEAFTRANVKDFGGGDLRDILAGVDAVLKKVPVDANRLGVTGWSYGGYMTMWTVTQTNRFRAAVAGAGIANWLSYYGENSIDQWMIPYFGASVYSDPAVYAKSSPINHIKQVKTPTLVVVGERDGECPAPQSFEFWHALKTLGVPTELVVYAGEGHAFRKPADRRDVLRRTLAWFDRYLAAP